MTDPLVTVHVDTRRRCWDLTAHRPGWWHRALLIAAWVIDRRDVDRG